MRYQGVVILFIGVFVFAACSSTNENTQESQPANGQRAEEIVPSERPNWRFIEMTDARSNETFTLADFAGKTVFVEPMATWCSNCRTQLNTVSQVRNQLGEEDFVFIGLSIETNISSDDLAQYQANQGFDWRFAVLTEDALRVLVDHFGRSITNPPSTPHFIIRPDGSYTDVYTGQESANELIQQLTEASRI